MTENMKYYFGFRVTGPTGEWVVCGPYNTREQAKVERNNSKAADCYVTIPFVASSKQEAENKVHIF